MSPEYMEYRAIFTVLDKINGPMLHLVGSVCLSRFDGYHFILRISYATIIIELR